MERGLVSTIEVSINLHLGDRNSGKGAGRQLLSIGFFCDRDREGIPNICLGLSLCCRAVPFDRSGFRSIIMKESTNSKWKKIIQKLPLSVLTFPKMLQNLKAHTSLTKHRVCCPQPNNN